MFEKIVSGGQTGVDRAALDVAIASRIAHGGWCPRGRKAEDGILDGRYALRETEADDYRVRTEYNVRDSDATLVLCAGTPAGGTALTVAFARARGKPIYILDMNEKYDLLSLQEWLDRNHVRVLNVAGPRESNSRGIYERARRLLQELVDATAISDERRSRS